MKLSWIAVASLSGAFFAIAAHATEIFVRENSIGKFGSSMTLRFRRRPVLTVSTAEAAARRRQHAEKFQTAFAMPPCGQFS
jgi:hypothetical protein